jgi:hypothetical protein
MEAFLVPCPVALAFLVVLYTIALSFGSAIETLGRLLRLALVRGGTSSDLEALWSLIKALPRLQLCFLEPLLY